MCGVNSPASSALKSDAANICVDDVLDVTNHLPASIRTKTQHLTHHPVVPHRYRSDS
jgi:hypothetical protein